MLNILTGGTKAGLGVGTIPLFENMGHVLRPNLHRNSEGGDELFWWSITLSKNSLN